ncbi:hypothetical protein ACFXPT_10965 [Streptomyces goshikiensis]|uniref:hypothetical protein n=1 Tax=Streptomyces goshikiensis TaxID=1942 RepID=UPI0036A6840F
MSPADLETQVLQKIQRDRKEDGGIYWTRVVGGFLGVEGREVEAALDRLHGQGRVRLVGREKTQRRVFLLGS